MIPSRKYISLAFSKPGSICMTWENASSAWSKEPYLSYSIPIPYQSLGSYIEWGQRLSDRVSGWGIMYLWITKVDQRILVGGICLL